MGASSSACCGGSRNEKPDVVTVELPEESASKPVVYGFESADRAWRLSAIMRFGLPLGTGLFQSSAKYILEEDGLRVRGKPNQSIGVGGFAIGTTRHLGDQDAMVEILVVSLSDESPIAGALGVISDGADRDNQLGISRDSWALLSNGSFYKDGSLKRAALCAKMKAGNIVRLEWKAAKQLVVWYIDGQKVFEQAGDIRGWSFGVGGIYDYNVYLIAKADVPVVPPVAPAKSR